MLDSELSEDDVLIAEGLSKCFFEASEQRFAAPTPILTRVIRGRRTGAQDEEEDDDDDEVADEDEGDSDALERLAPDTPAAPDFVWALRDVSFRLRRGQAVALVGDTGAGKTTLLRVLSGSTRATHGRALVQGLASPLTQVAVRLMQTDFSPARNAAFGASVSGMSRRRLRPHLGRVFELAGVSEHERRRGITRTPLNIAAATALAADYDLLLLDDPFARTEPDFGERCLELIERRLADGAAVVFEAQDPALLRRVCTLGLWLHEGRQMAFGELDEVLHAYAVHQRESAAGASGDAPPQANDRAAIVAATCKSEGAGLATFEVVLEVPGSSVVADVGVVLRHARGAVVVLEHPSSVKCWVGVHRFRVAASDLPDGRYAGRARVRLRDGNWHAELWTAHPFSLVVGNDDGDEIVSPADLSDEESWTPHAGEWEREAGPR